MSQPTPNVKVPPTRKNKISEWEQIGKLIFIKWFSVSSLILCFVDSTTEDQSFKAPKLGFVDSCR